MQTSKLMPQQMDIPGTEYYVKIDGTVWRKYKTVPDRMLIPYKSTSRKSKRRQRYLKLCKDGKYRSVTMAWVMKQTYFKGLGEDMRLVHIDGSADNCAVWNLKPMELQEMGRRFHRCNDSRVVLKKDADTGEVLAIYTSAREAGRQNYMSYQSVLNACNNRNKRRKGIAADGYRYEWEA